MKRILLSVLAFIGINAHVSQAQEWPERPVRIVVGFAPGGANDIVSRLLAQRLTERLKQTFYVENKPGAGARIAASYVAKEKADGYTFLMGAPGLLVLNHFLYKDVDYRLADFAGVSLVGTLPYVLVASPKLNVGTVAELVALAKRRPGALNHGSTGSGPTLVQQLFKDKTGIQFQNVLYKGTAPALQDLMRGDLHFAFDLIAGNLEQIKAGTIRALAVSAPRRSTSLPEVPTMVESGVAGFEPTNWYGLVAPANTPRTVLEKLSKDINAILAEPDTRQRLIQLGVEPSGSTPQEFAEHLRKEYALWEAVTRNAGIQKE
jgi:tripartite-type tricarboxylate transporter receptor subunit TctC